MSNTASTAWIVEQPDRCRKSIDTGPTERMRKPHKKSRNGCRYCKYRRIKCDEGKPACGNCAHRKRRCEYGLESQGSGCSSINLKAMSSLLPELLTMQIVDDLETKTDDGMTRLTKRHALECLNHFYYYEQPWLKSEKVQRVAVQHGSRLLIDHAYLLHAVLAISAAHLAYLNPTTSTYQASCGIHYQESLSLYAKAINAGIENQNIDALFFASFLHGMLSFISFRLPVDCKGDMNEAGWMTCMRGTLLLLAQPSVSQRIRHGIWKPAVQEHETWQEEARLAVLCPSRSKAHSTIESLIELNESGFREEDPLFAERLHKLRTIDLQVATAQDIGGYASFITEGPIEFVQRVRARDEAAMLLLLCWCMLFSRIDQWWVRNPAKEECRQIHSYLSRSADTEILEALESAFGQYAKDWW